MKKFKLLATDSDKTHYKEFDSPFKAGNLTTMLLDLMKAGDRIVIEVADDEEPKSDLPE